MFHAHKSNKKNGDKEQIAAYRHGKRNYFHSDKRIPSQKQSAWRKVSQQADTADTHRQTVAVTVEDTLTEQLSQHLKALQFGHVRHMDAVITQHGVGDLIALMTGKTEEMHVLIVHTDEPVDARRFLREQVIGMKRDAIDKGGIAEIKAGTGLIGIKIGEEAHETAQTHHEDKVEVGVFAPGLIQPLHARTHIII